MAKNVQIVMPNAQEPNKPFTLLHISDQNTIKPPHQLPFIKLQIKELLIGHDVQKFIDGSHPYPLVTITKNHITMPNLEYHT